MHNKISIASKKLRTMNYVNSFKATCIIVFFLVVSASSQTNTICPFDYFFHMGDGVFDIGNAIAIKPSGPRLPAARLPYGMTTPGHATGRWCNGLTDIDIGGAVMGFPNPMPYLSGNTSSSNAIIFAVARSPVLDRKFFRSRGIKIPAHAKSLRTQMKWFRTHLRSICSTPTDCASKLAKSIFFTGDVEANDIAISLIHGKSIKQVRSYVSSITRAQINAATEAIRMGTTRVIITGNVPIGCYPYILTKFRTNNPKDYDDLGCLKKINELIVYKNNNLKRAVRKLSQDFPNVMIFYGDFYSAYLILLAQTVEGRPDSRDLLLKTCCGIGGKYNYNSRRFCGAKGVPVCSNPDQYIHWDGIHLTEDANYRLGSILQEGALEALNCTR